MHEKMFLATSTDNPMNSQSSNRANIFTDADEESEQITEYSAAANGENGHRLYNSSKLFIHEVMFVYVKNFDLCHALNEWIALHCILSIIESTRSQPEFIILMILLLSTSWTACQQYSLNVTSDERDSWNDTNQFPWMVIWSILYKSIRIQLFCYVWNEWTRDWNNFTIFLHAKAALGFLDGELQILYSCNGIVISDTFILTSNALI